MANFTPAELREAMDNKTNIRNMAVIAHVGHGKSTLVDSLVAANSRGVAADGHVTDTREDEAQRGMSIKSTGISLLHVMDIESLQAYKGQRDGNRYLINLIDSPGHVEFSSEVTAALRVTDGALLVVDCIEGVCVQTETVLRQALGEGVKPILCLNKMDELFPGLQVGRVKPESPGEHAYNILRNVIENANHIMAANKDEQLGDVQFCPHNGTVVFSSGLHGWAFRLTDIAKKYASKFRMDESKFVKKLWGDHFYDRTTQKWTSERTGPGNCVRGFVYFCYNPLKRIFAACMSDDKAELWRLCGKLGVKLSDDDKKLPGVALVTCVMQAWLPASTALLEMIILHLPSPCEAQMHRVDKLYEGPLNDTYAQAMRNCDPEGPLMLYVSKMISPSQDGRFLAFGRVFSGRIANGMKVRIMGPSYVPGLKNDLCEKTVQKTFIWMGRNQYEVEDIPCGTTVSISGLEEYITKSGTLTNEGKVDAWPIRRMKFCVHPVIYVSVECKVLKDVPELVEGLKRLSISDPIVICSAVKSRSCTIAGAGELHLQICCHDLQGVFMDGAKIYISHPEIFLRETILGESGTRETKSPNGQNRLFMSAHRLDEKLVKAIEDGLLGPRTDLAARTKILAKSGWDEGLANKIWCFGPGSFGPNMVVDMCKGGSIPNQVKETLVECFQTASEEGALAEEIIRGICFEVHHVLLHDDQKYRHTKNQLIPMIKRAFHESQLRAKPRLLEPVFVVEIQAPESAMDIIIGLLNQYSSNILQRFEREGTQLITTRSYLHGGFLVGFAEAFRAATSGQVTPQCVFSHWGTMSSDPLKASSLTGQMVLDIRKAKKMKELSVALKELEL